MNIIYYLFFLLLPSLLFAQNDLKYSPNTFLQQFQNDPINWHYWSKETLELAQHKKKLIIINFSYAACHWCKVMEVQCFQSKQVAQYMNEHFICIKVDREEHPHLNKIYEDAIVQLGGYRGWPLNVVCLPDGSPVYGGGYYSSAQWLQMLHKVQQFVYQNPDRAEEQAESLRLGIEQKNSALNMNPTTSSSPDELLPVLQYCLNAIDVKNNGFQGRRKFPLPTTWNFLLEYNYYQPSNLIQNQVENNLKHYYQSLLFDHVAGGFFHCTEDSLWQQPQWNKTLYDNTLLISLYAKSHRQKPLPYKAEVVRRSINFIDTYLRDADGLYASSVYLENKDGAYYHWTYTELQKRLTKNELQTLKKHCDIPKKGQTGLIASKNTEFITLNILKKLHQNRKKRKGLRRDSKRIVAWNALLIQAKIEAYTTLKDSNLLQEALLSAKQILSYGDSSKGMLPRFLQKQSNTNALLQDYAFSIEAFLMLYQVSFDVFWLEQAQKYMDYAIKHYYNEEQKVFFQAIIDNTALPRSLQLEDDFLPNANAQMLGNLSLLHYYFPEKAYQVLAKGLIRQMKTRILSEPSLVWAHWYRQLLRHSYPLYQIIIMGEKVDFIKAEMQMHYLPNVCYAGSAESSDLSILKDKYQKEQTLIYRCVEERCQLPSTDYEDILRQLKSN